MKDRSVIIGAGLAGHAAAEAMREAGFEGSIEMLGVEPLPPYERPPLSKEILRGERQIEDLLMWGPSRYVEIEIDLALNVSATRIDAAAGSVSTSDGRELGFDRLLIATGAEPIVPAQPGFAMPDVLTLRTAADAVALRERLATRPHVAVLGAGFVGTEVAASCREAGCEVTLIDNRPGPLYATLGVELSAALARIHREHGVRLEMEATVDRVLGDRHAEAVELVGGRVLECDLLLVAAGVRPRTVLAAEAGLAVADGILVDEFCATGAPGIFAAGDVARWQHPLWPEPIRVEHFDNALAQGAAAGRAMAGLRERRAALPSFWSDQYEATLLWTGFPGPWDEVEVDRGEAATGLTVRYLRGGRVHAAASLAGPRAIRGAAKSILAAVSAGSADGDTVVTT